MHEYIKRHRAEKVVEELSKLSLFDSYRCIDTRTPSKIAKDMLKKSKRRNFWNGVVTSLYVCISIAAVLPFGMWLVGK